MIYTNTHSILTITDMHHQAEIMLAYTRFYRCRMMQTLWISFWNEYVGRPQCIVTFGFERRWKNVDGWCMVTVMDSWLSCDMRTLPIISTTTECKTKRCQGSVSAVRSADTRQVERCRNAIEFRWNAKVAVRTPSSWNISVFPAISRRSGNKAMQSQCRYVWQRFKSETPQIGEASQKSHNPRRLDISIGVN